MTFSPNEAAYFFFETPPQNHPKICFRLIFFTYSYWYLCGSFRKFEFQVLGVILGAHHTPKVGCFFKILKMQLFDCFITQLVKKLQQLALYEMIEDILPIVLNTKRPLSDIWLPRYKQSSFGCFRKNSEFRFFSKTPKTVLLITHQQNIAQRPFCIQNEMQDILYHFIEGPLL